MIFWNIVHPLLNWSRIKNEFHLPKWTISTHDINIVKISILNYTIVCKRFRHQSQKSKIKDGRDLTKSLQTNPKIRIYSLLLLISHILHHVHVILLVEAIYQAYIYGTMASSNSPSLSVLAYIVLLQQLLKKASCKCIVLIGLLNIHGMEPRG
jgi:hypothetical protein